MRSSSLIFLAGFLYRVQADFSASPVAPAKRQSTCPTVWTDIASDLQSTFISDGACTDDARAAIRAAFHDCFPGSCDGSLILANECTDRGENAQIVDICSTLGDKATSFNVSTADMIQFSAAVAIASCSGGPITSFYAGRTDSSTANPTGQLPGPNANASALVSDFAAKGFSITELVALAGAHTIGKQLDGSAMDSTVANWDSGFYTEVADNTAPDPLNSDRFLSNSSETSGQWSSVGASSTSFADAFVPAMEKMSLLGNDKASLTDCSSVVSSYAAGTLSQKAVAQSSDGTSSDGTSEQDDGSSTETGTGTGTGTGSVKASEGPSNRGAVGLMRIALLSGCTILTLCWM